MNNKDEKDLKTLAEQASNKKLSKEAEAKRQELELWINFLNQK